MEKQRIARIYLEEDNNCAETILRAANEEYGLNLSDGDAKLIAAFGGGMGCGGTCGALAGALAVLGRVAVEGHAHATEGFKERCAALVSRFERELGSRDCAALKARYFEENGDRCLKTVLLAAQVLERYLLENGLIDKKEEAQIPPDEIKRVKGMGFLNNKGTGRFNARIITRNGRLAARELSCVAHAAERFGDGHVALTTRLTMEVTGVPYGQIDAFRAFVGEAGLETGGTGSKVRPVVSCKGTTCQYGLIDTYELSEKIHRRFYEGYRDVQLPHKFKIAVGGCPNNCVKPDLNDLGIVGARVPLFDADRCRACGKCTLIDACPIGAATRRGLADARAVIDTARCNSCGRCIGKCVFKLNDAARPGYRVLIGGRWGKAFAQGRALRHLFLSEEEVLSAVESAILLFRDQGKTGERFADTVARISFEEAERQILGGELLTRRGDILGRRVVGGATC